MSLVYLDLKVTCLRYNWLSVLTNDWQHYRVRNGFDVCSIFIRYLMLVHTHIISIEGNMLWLMCHKWHQHPRLMRIVQVKYVIPHVTNALIRKHYDHFFTCLFFYGFNLNLNYPAHLSTVFLLVPFLM